MSDTQSFLFRGAFISAAGMSGTKAQPNSKWLSIVADMTDELRELLGLAVMDPAIDKETCKKKLRLSLVVFTPNGLGTEKEEFQFAADTLGPFEFVRLKKDNGLVTEARFDVDTSDAEVMAKLESYRNRYAAQNGVLKVHYSSIETAKEENEPKNDSQMSFDQAAEARNIGAIAEAIDAKRRRRAGAKVQ